MARINYSQISEINELQTDIMLFVDKWVHEVKTPVPHREILREMKEKGIEEFTTVNAINALITKRYIRRAVTVSNKSSYVQCRRV